MLDVLNIILELGGKSEVVKRQLGLLLVSWVLCVLIYLQNAAFVTYFSLKHEIQHNFPFQF
jgi:hypothetical protein